MCFNPQVVLKSSAEEKTRKKFTLKLNTCFDYTYLSSAENLIL